MSTGVKTRSSSVPRNETQVNKRILSPQEEDNKKAKKTKTTIMTELSELKKLITASSESIANKIDASQKSLEQKFHELASKVEGDVSAIKASVVEFKAEIAGELCEVKEQLNIHSQRIENHEDDIQRIQRSNDLRITGFQAKANEDLHAIYNAIATEIGFDNPPLTPTIERIPIRNKTTGLMIKSNTILIQFATLKQKQSFYSCYLSKLPLKPEIFGLSTASRIVIGENLTKQNTQLFIKAHTMKKMAISHRSSPKTVWSKYGLKKARANKHTLSEALLY